jgi:imidazolonepropionase-like amidohydrolase
MCMVMRFLNLLVWIFVFVVGSSTGFSAQTTTVFEGARLIIGDGTPSVEDATIIVRDGLIERTGQGDQIQAPGETVRVDLSGKTVMPMLLNVHGHIGYLKGVSVDLKNYDRENILNHLHRLSYYGVGAFQSLGTDRDDLELRIRDEQRLGRLESATALLTAGLGIVAPNKNGVNGGPSFAADVVLEADTPDEGRRHVRALINKKVDIIKIWVDDRRGTKPKMKPEVYRAIIDEAHTHDMRVVAHVYYLDDAKALVRAGIDGFAHLVRALPGVDEELARLMKEKDVFACSTMGIQWRAVGDASWLDDPSLAETVAQDVLDKLRVRGSSGRVARDTEAARQMFVGLQHSIKKLHDAGVRIGLCCDTGITGSFPGFAEHRELEMMVNAGIPPMDVIRAGTQTSASILGLEERGTLTPGKRADFIVLDANPLERIQNTRRIVAVYSGGRLIDRDALRKQWSKASKP